MMKTIHTGWSQTARRHTLYLFAIFTLLGTFLLPSCRDEELIPTPHAQGANAGVSHADGTTTSGLVQNEDGTWTATRRVPLVGVGRMMNNISTSLIEVGTWEAEVKNLTDLDLDNYTSGSSVVGVGLVANQIVSVIDVGHVYAPGQKAGFVFSTDDSGLLEVNVIKLFSVQTFLNGEPQETMNFSSATELVDLGLGNVTGGNAQQKNVIEVTTNKPFDEIRLCQGGISVSLLNSMKIYYAYVGENPIIPAVNYCAESPISTTYFDNKVGYPDFHIMGGNEQGWSSGYREPSLDKLIDGDLDNGIGIDPVSQLFQPTMTVDFGREIPAGSEVGFYTTSGSFLKVGVGSSVCLRSFSGEKGDVDYSKALDEYTHSEIISLEVGSGGESYINMVTTQPCQRLMIQYVGLNVDLGVTSVHYAYVREPVRVDASSYFNLSSESTYLPTYRFALPKGIDNESVEITLVRKPGRAENADVVKSKVDGSYALVNMNVVGEYVVEAVYTDPVTQQTVTTQATIRRTAKNTQDCRTPLINADENDKTYSAIINEGFSGVSVGGEVPAGVADYLIDNDQTNCISGTGFGLNLVEDKLIASVKNTKGIINSNIAEGQRTRVGFVINRNADFLGLDVLKFLRIKLFDGDKEVFSEIGTDNNGISLGLIQATNGTKNLACLSVETDAKFDRVELWSTGLLNVEVGGTLEIYYAYYEDANTTCANPGEECMQLITNANYGAEVTTSIKGLLHVGNGIGGLANIVDNDITTGAQFVTTAAGGINDEIIVTFDKLQAHTGDNTNTYQEVGFILSTTTGVLNVGLLDFVQIHVYEGEQEVETITSGSGLVLKVAGDGSRQYYSVRPKVAFDGLGISFGEGLSVANAILINGVYLLPDFDGDGVADCIEDELSTIISGVYAEPENICEGSPIQFRVEGGMEEVDYTLTFKDKDGNPLEGLTFTAQISQKGYFTFEDDFTQTLPAGRYYIDVTKGGSPEWSNAKMEINPARTPLMTVHPNETTWTGDAGTSDWNTWENWSKGTPWSCTNVIIPSPENSPVWGKNIIHYPVLTENTDAKCELIHFEPGGELVNQQYLQYETAWVDMNLNGGSYNLLSAPMQGMATGDMFLLAEANRNQWLTDRATADDKGEHMSYFMELNESSYPENRKNPLVYQRFWNDVVSNKTISRAGYSTEDDAIAAEADGELLFTDWSRSFNRVSEIYESGQGFALRVGGTNDTGKDYQFHFPKTYQTYNYYTLHQDEAVGSDKVTRTGTGKLMIDQSFPNSLNLYRETEGTMFLFGNPFMAHISIKKLLEANSNISAIYVYREGDANGTGKYFTIGNNGTLTTDAATPTEIAPMEAVFIKVIDERAATAFRLALDEDMLGQKGQADTYNTFIPQLRMTASRNGSSASCVVLHSGEASDGYDSREDAALLVGKEEGTDVAVYTTAGRKALSIQRVNGAARIPVGFYMKRTGDVDLKFEAGDDWSGWQLTDTQTGRSYPLEGTVSLDNVADGTGRFYLEKR